MTWKPAFSVMGNIETVDGVTKLSIKSPGHYQHQIKKLKDGPVSVTVSTKTPTRSKQQLAYHFVLVEYLAEHCGYTKDEMHDLLMRTKFGTKTLRFRGRTHEVRRSVSDAANLPTADMADLISYDLETCAELGVHVPTPEELGYIHN